MLDISSGDNHSLATIECPEFTQVKESLNLFIYTPLLTTDLTKVSPDQDWTQMLNPQSLERLTGSLVEPSLKLAPAGARFQFERTGYFCVDPDTSPSSLVFIELSH